MHHFKTVIIAIMSLGAAALLIFGPKSTGNIPNDRKNDIIISYWEKWAGTEAKQMQQIVNDFNDSVGRDKHIFVQYVSISSIDQKTRIAMAAGVPPDIAGVWDPNLVQYAALGALEPLEDLARSHGITKETYKPVYWRQLQYDGHLWALISTPAVVALHYNKAIFHENAAALRAAGLDPDRPPQTLQELDRYAKVLNTFSIVNGKRQIDRAGYLPLEPGWYVGDTCLWFGGKLFDEETGKFTLTDPRVVKAYEWIQSYSKNIGPDLMSVFQSGVGKFDSPQNAFLAGKVAMEQQGPWMANYIFNLKPQMSQVHVSRGEAMKQSRDFQRDNCSWGAAPFPSAVPGLEMVTRCGFDALVIPRGSKHKNEAFEFIAYVNRQDVMEKLCSLHCKNSPLRKVSAEFIAHHPNPYIEVFEALANSPNAQGAPRIPILPEVGEELNNMTQLIYHLKVEPAEALRESQEKLQRKYDEFMAIQRMRAQSQ